MKKLLFLAVIVLLGQGCVVADIPEEITHNIQISGEDLNFLAGRCFDENLSKDEFLSCLEEDLVNDGFSLATTK